MRAGKNKTIKLAEHPNFRRKNAKRFGLLGLGLLTAFTIGLSSHLSFLIRMHVEDQIVFSVNNFLSKYYDYFPHLAKIDVIFLIIFSILLMPIVKISASLTNRISQLIAGPFINRKQKIQSASNSFFSKAREKDKIKAGLGTLIIVAPLAFSVIGSIEESVLLLEKPYVSLVEPFIVPSFTPFGRLELAMGFENLIATEIALLIVSFLFLSFALKYLFFICLWIVGFATRCPSCSSVFATSDAGIETIERYAEWQNETVSRNGRQYTESVPYNVHRYWQYIK